MSEAKELIFGTGNQAKIQQVQGALAAIGIRVIGINTFDVKVDIVEDAETVQENAKKKAVAYAKALGRTVFSMDNALYFEGLLDNEQPGLHVRRVDGVERLTDEEMVNSYVELIKRHGEQLEGRWEFGVSIAKADGSSVEDSIISPRLFVARASSKIVAGYPLESIQVDPETGKYISEMSDEEQAQFWQRKIGGPLAEFVKKNL